MSGPVRDYVGEALGKDALVAADRAIALAVDKLHAVESEALRLAPLIRDGAIARDLAVNALTRAAEAHGLCVSSSGRDTVRHVIGMGLAGRSAGVGLRLVSDTPVPDRLRPLDLRSFLALPIKPREMLLDPIIPEKGLAMTYASRGTGKTHVALSIGHAVATGTNFLKWKAPKPRRVLLIDGEMPASALQERLASIVAGAETEPNPDALKILAGDLIEEGGIGNLASRDVQDELEPWLAGTELLILDNLSSLTAVIRDNDAESWGPIQDWLLRLRRRDTSVLIVHHAGKGGQQRGTSRREDVLDTVISLRRPEDYRQEEGTRFEVHIEKGRGVLGDDAKPFEAKLETIRGAAVWTMREIEDVNLARVKALLDDELSVREIADETGIPRSTVQRLKKKIASEEG
jgi:putative DNA primase/helicase